MKVKRRDFLKGVGGSLLFAAASPVVHAAGPSKKRLPAALGFLYDSTLCIGCQSCMAGCKKTNNMPVEHTGTDKLWDNPQDLSDKTLTIVKKFSHGTGKKKNSETDGYAFIRRQCMHCVNPACVMACPVSALSKDPSNGLVSYDQNACIGCRCCQIACPFNVPKFQWGSAFPEIIKCQLCFYLVARGEIAACCSACPNGASVFGPVEKLLNEARRRQQLKPGEYYNYPVAYIDSPRKLEQKVSHYQPHIYGETEGGGTQILMLAGVSFSKLGLPNLPDKSHADLPVMINSALYQYLILPALVLGGLAFFVKKGTDQKD